MMKTADALSTIEHSPQLPDHIRYLKDVLSAEQRRRERFYDEIDESTKAEFINGQVVVHSPARLEHLDVVSNIVNLLRNFVLGRGLGTVFTEKCMVQCRRNDYEPDICFFALSKTAALTPHQSLFPPPDLIIEVLSPSTEKNDRTTKFEDYALHQVSEYWIIDADERIIEQYVIPAGANSYTLHARNEVTGRLASVAVAGFDVPAAAFFDARENQAALMGLMRSSVSEATGTIGSAT